MPTQHTCIHAHWCTRTFDFQILLYFPLINRRCWRIFTASGQCCVWSTHPRSLHRHSNLKSPTHPLTIPRSWSIFIILLFYIFLRRYYHCHLISVRISTQKRVLSRHKIHDGLTTLFTRPIWQYYGVDREIFCFFFFPFFFCFSRSGQMRPANPQSLPIRGIIIP